jgi:hypothetical protein
MFLQPSFRIRSGFSKLIIESEELATFRRSTDGEVRNE